MGQGQKNKQMNCTKRAGHSQSDTRLCLEIFTGSAAKKSGLESREEDDDDEKKKMKVMMSVLNIFFHGFINLAQTAVISIALFMFLVYAC